MYRSRSKKGALSSLFFVAACLALMIIGSLGIDLSHAFYARSQLQTAADNAALTGAYALATPVPNKNNIVKSEEFARTMASRNTVDGVAVIHDGDGTVMSVNAELHPVTGPQFCHISVTRNVPTSLARLVGVSYLPVTVNSSAGAYMTNKAIMPNWLTNLAVSYRVKNNTLNTDTNDKDNLNSWFISDWKGTDNPIVKFGSTNVIAGAGSLASLADGVLYNVAIVNGGKPEDKMPTRSTVIGSTAIIVKKHEGANKALITFVPGSIIKAQPGPWQVSGNSTSNDLQFAQLNGQWRIALVR
jgi:Flp pilus assembly protein TadG